MQKKYVILIYVLIILLASIGVSVIVWNDLDTNTLDEQYVEKYNEYKEDLLECETYTTSSQDIDINVEVYESNSSYLVSTKFTNPRSNYKNLIILVIDEKELEKETDKIYPSIGIVGNFNNEFVVSSPNQKTTHSKLTMNYESTFKSGGVLIYLQYFDGSSTITSRLNVSVK